MSVPSWRRPPERAAPQVSAYERVPATGQTRPEPALAGAGVGATGVEDAPEPADGVDAGCAAGSGQRRRCGCGGGRSGSRRLSLLTLLLVPDALLAFEFLLDGFVDEALLLDLAEPHDLFFGGDLERGEGLDRRFGLQLLVGELFSRLLDVGHHGVELVEVRDHRVRRHRCQHVGGQHVVGLVEVDEEWEVGPAGADELTHRLRFESVAHLVGACLDGGEFLLRLGDLELAARRSRTPCRTSPGPQRSPDRGRPGSHVPPVPPAIHSTGRSPSRTSRSSPQRAAPPRGDGRAFERVEGDGT